MLLKRFFLVTLLFLPLSAWAFIKPVRIFMPEIAGLTCYNSVCVDDPARMPEAAELYEDALEYVGSRLTPFEKQPLMIFCSTISCYKSFGGGAERAITFPKVGSLIAPTSWASHFVRHELIHSLQAQKRGMIRMLLDPAWFREGMAYSLSDPPAYDMPDQFIEYRDRYESWTSSLGENELWSAARDL